MAGSTVDISAGGIRNEAQAIDKQNKAMLSDFNELINAIKALKTVWTGDAAESAQGAIKKMEPKFAEFQKVVEKGVKSLNANADKWEKTEKKLESLSSDAADQYK